MWSIRNRTNLLWITGQPFKRLDYSLLNNQNAKMYKSKITVYYNKFWKLKLKIKIYGNVADMLSVFFFEFNRSIKINFQFCYIKKLKKIKKSNINTTGDKLKIMKSTLTGRTVNRPAPLTLTPPPALDLIAGLPVPAACFPCSCCFCKDHR